MSVYDNWLLEGSEPEEWDRDSAPNGLCDFCGGPLDEDCETCEPRVALEDSPVRLSVTVTNGVFRWSGWCADRPGAAVRP